MRMKDVIITKICCLSELEFRLMLDVYAIKNLTGFEAAICLNSEDERKIACNTAMFTLYKKGFLYPASDDGQFEICEELAYIFHLISKSFVCIIPLKGNEQNVDVCIYAGKGKELVIMESGRKEDEYARLRIIEKNVLEEYFVESAILKEQNVTVDVAEMIEVNPEELINGVVQTAFVVKSAADGHEIGKVSVVQYRMFDRILVQKNGNTRDCTMDNGAVIAELYNMISNHEQ